jgi:hypothetical protein
MEDEKFLQQIREKIARLTGREVEVVLGEEREGGTLTVEMGGPVPKVTLTPRVLEHAGLARMSIEYAVACIKAGREIDLLEFHALLRRN